MRFLLPAIVWVGTLAAFCQAAPTRLAVLAVDSPELGKHAALFESELLKLSDVELLERASVQEILKEQKLQAALTAGANAERMRLAKLLKADVLVTLQAQQKPTPHARLVIFEARQGLRLYHEPFSPGKVTDDVKKLIPAVKTALERFRSPRREIVAIPSLLDASLTFEQNHLGSAIARVIEQNLLSRPEVLVVELEEAHSISREAELSGMAIEARVLPLYLIGEYHFATRVENRIVSYKLEIKRGAKVLDTQKNDGVPVDQFVASIQSDALKLLDKAIGKSAPAIDPEIENKQLLNRASDLQLIGDYQNALELIEAALVVKPDQPLVHGQAAMLIHFVANPRLNEGDAQENLTPKEKIARGRANAKLLQRSLPHFEANWKGDATNNNRKYGSQYNVVWKANPPDAEWQRELDDYRKNLAAAIERILDYKAEHKIHDEALFRLRKYLLDPRIELQENAHIPQVLDPKLLQIEMDRDLKYAKQFAYLKILNSSPYTAQKWVHFLAPKFHYSTSKPEFKRDNLAQAYLAHLDQVIAIENAPDLHATAVKMRDEMLQRMDPAQNVAQQPPPPRKILPRDPSEIDVKRREIPLTEVLADGRRQPFRVPQISKWLTVSPTCDVIKFQDKFYWMRAKGEVQRITASALTAADPTSLLNAELSADGRYVWFLLPGKAQLLVVLDSQSDAVWTYGAEQGLPPMNSNRGGAAICGYTEGKACVAGSFNYKRRWIAAAKLDPKQGIVFEVFHEANRRWTGPTSGQQYQYDILTEAEVVHQMESMRGRRTPDGPVEHRILLYSLFVILVDPETRQVADFQKEMRNNYYNGTQKKQEDRLIGQGWLKNANGKGGSDKTVSFGFPDLTVKSEGKKLPDGFYFEHDGNSYILTDEGPLVTSPEMFGKYRELRQEFVNGFAINRPDYSGFHGWVFQHEDKLYTFDLVNRQK